ncbi:MAG: hypothetical protein WD749_03045 [Phycisphaerales bacterium]
MYVLGLDDLRIEPLPTTGAAPGWIHKHKATLDPSRGSITVRGGEIDPGDSSSGFRRNVDEFRLDFASCRWDRLTEREWRQFEIAPVEDRRDFTLSLPDEVFRPKVVPAELLSREPDDPNYLRRRIRVDEVVIEFVEDVFSIRVLVAGELPALRVDQVLEDVRRNLGEVSRLEHKVVEL